jgi:hypothetical protein
MSSFFEEYSVETFAVFSLLCIVVIVWLRWLRHWHVGFGATIRLRDSDGSVWITSRLLNYPLEQQGVSAPTRLVSVDGHAMKFESAKAFKVWFASHKPKRGVEERWVVDGGAALKTVTMTPVLVTTSIPEYWNPNAPLRAEEFFSISDPHLKRGLRYCNKTGRYIPSYSLSGRAIWDIIDH